MTPQQWERIKQIFDAALAEASADRATFLQANCGDDSVIRSEVERLLAEHERASGFLDRPSHGNAFALSGSQISGTEAPLTGQKISHYEILAKLGEGGMGIVYRAFDTQLLRPVALKVLSHNALADPESNRRFLREARTASALNHPNIAHVYEVGEADGTRFIVMEHIEGRTLAATIRDLPLDFARVLELGLQAADALAEAHEHGIIHRDVKPSNIMITPRGQLKILDFGLAKVRSKQPDQERGLTDSSLTSPGLVVGTTRYMSPEQVLGHDVDQRSDIFSLGVVFYEMVAGHPAFAGGTATETMDQVLHSEPEPIAAIRSNAPRELGRIIRKCIEKDRGKRYSSARELYTDLLQLRENRPLAFGFKMDRRKFLFTAALRWVAAAALLVTALIASLYLIRGRGDAIDSLAVLPLANASRDADIEYLVDGITENLINSLSQVPKLRVMARSTVFSYKGKAADPLEVGRKLKVRAVLTGRVAQQGDALKVGTELVRVADGSQLWGEQSTWPLANILTMQADMVKQISEKLRLRLTGEQRQRSTKSYTDNTEAYHLYLRGRYYSLNLWTADGFKKGLDYLNRAITLDPTYALAYAGLAATYYDASGVYYQPQEAMPKAKAAAVRALDLDEEVAEAHTALAEVMAYYEWNWKEAEKHYQRALALNPNYALAHLYYGQYLVEQGRLQGIEEMKQAERLDPLTPSTNMLLPLYYYSARRYGEAVSQLREIIETYPNFVVTHSFLGMFYEQQGKIVEAIAEFNEARRLDPEQPFTLGYLGHAYASLGKRSEAREMIEEMKRRAQRVYVDPFAVAIVYAGLDEKDEAFMWLERAYDAHSESLLLYKNAPLLDGLRSDPRFTNLFRRMGLAS